jgi:hypothetical protein
MVSVAPSCPISNNQFKTRSSYGPVRMPVIPPATDLSSLINTVNVIRDVLRQLTTSLTVNNTVVGAPPSTIYESSTLYISVYPDWYQSFVDAEVGYMYHTDKSNKITGKDKSQRAYVIRQNAIEYENWNETVGLLEKPFTWRYVKKLDQPIGAV